MMARDHRAVANGFWSYSSQFVRPLGGRRNTNRSSRKKLKVNPISCAAILAVARGPAR